VYPDERVARFVTDNFIPVRLHVRDDAEEFKKLSERYSAFWTPTILELTPDGTEQHRVEGFLEAPELLAQLNLGLGKTAFKAKRWQEAERHHRAVVDRYPKTDAAQEALYWAGVSRYRETGDAAVLAQTSTALEKQYPGSTWTKKASIWKSQDAR
jgi:hypothetical protein